MSGKQFATLVIITFIVGMIWLISDIIFNTKASVQVSPRLEALLAPINPTFNDRVLKEIDKDVVEASLITPALRQAAPQPSSSPVSSPKPTIAPLPSSSPSPTPLFSSSPFPSSSPISSASPIATISGTLSP